MQLYSPSYGLKILNLEYVSKDEYDVNHAVQVWEDGINWDQDAVYFETHFEGIIKTRNDFDLRTFPFDKQEISIQFAETTDPNLNLTATWQLYANRYE